MKMQYDAMKLYKCTEADVKIIMDLQQEIIDGLLDKQVLRKNTEKMFLQCTQFPNITVIMKDKQGVVALAIFVDANGTEEDLSGNLVLYKPKKAGNIKLVMVREKYRGNRLQKILMLFLERYAVEKGYTCLCTTVSDKNKYSLNNIVQLSYEYDHSAIKYGGLQRKIFVKNVETEKAERRKKVLTYMEEMLQTKNIQNIIKDEAQQNSNFLEIDYEIAVSGDIVEYYHEKEEMSKYGILLDGYVWFKDDRSYLFERRIGEWKLKRVICILENL